MIPKRYFWVALSVVLLAGYLPLRAQFHVDVETGVVFSGYNDVRIPNATGTLISLSEELETDPTIFYRVRVGYRFKERHLISALFAPLSLQSKGQVDRTVHFEGQDFAPNTSLDALFRFNSYRLTYRYALHNSDRLTIGIGLTGKIRDAEVRLTGGGTESKKTNVGFVPLINFAFYWRFARTMGFSLTGDAAAASQGRAEDVLAALIYQATPRLGIKLGYRLLEGGADVDEVYNFTWLNYVVGGLTFTF